MISQLLNGRPLYSVEIFKFARQFFWGAHDWYSCNVLEHRQ